MKMHVKAWMMAGVVLMSAGVAAALPPPLPRPQPAPVDNELKPTDARMVFETREHNFGTILDIEEQTHAFTFRNNGTQPLVIGSITSTCGCTVPDMAKKVYEPGESGEVVVKYNPHGKKGIDSRSVTLMTNDAMMPQVKLTIQAEVKPLIVMEPTMVQMGQIDKGGTKEADIVIAGRLEDFKISHASTNMPDAFEVEVMSTEVREVGKEMLSSTLLRVRVKPRAPVGIHNAELTLRTNDPRRAVVTTQVLLNVLGDLSVVPPRLSLGRVNAGAEFAREFRLQSRSGRPFVIKEIVAKDDTIPLRFEYEADDPKNPTTYRVKVTGSVSEDVRRIVGGMIVRTDVRDEEVIEVQFNGFVQPR